MKLFPRVDENDKLLTFVSKNIYAIYINIKKNVYYFLVQMWIIAKMEIFPESADKWHDVD